MATTLDSPNPMPADASDEPPPLPGERTPELPVAEVIPTTPELPIEPAEIDLVDEAPPLPARQKVVADDEAPPSLPDESTAEGDDEEPPDLPPIPEPYNRAEWEVETTTEPVDTRPFLRRLAGGIENVFGFATIIVSLAVLSAIPILNFLSLGYLLQVSGNVARSGKIRNGFAGVKEAARAGSVILGAWLILWPVRIVSDLWKDAELLAPGSAQSNGYGTALFFLTVATVAHLCWALIRGGKLRHFFWPAPIAFIKWIRNRESMEEMGDKVADFITRLRLPHYFWLGARGFAGGLCWLIGPVGILIAAPYLPTGPAAFLSLFGSFGLFLVVLYLPFLQAHFALQNRLAAMFEIATVRQMFKRAPIAFWCALFITLLFAMPLYALKVELTAQEIAWLPGLVFMAFIFPARLLTGWAVSRAIRREAPRFVVVRWAMRLMAIPVVGFYVGWVYLSQFYSWDGVYSLLEQHAFMVPAPLMGI